MTHFEGSTGVTCNSQDLSWPCCLAHLQMHAYSQLRLNVGSYDCCGIYKLPPFTFSFVAFVDRPTPFSWFVIGYFKLANEISRHIALVRQEIMSIERVLNRWDPSGEVPSQHCGEVPSCSPRATLRWLAVIMKCVDRVRTYIWRNTNRWTVSVLLSIIFILVIHSCYSLGELCPWFAPYINGTKRSQTKNPQISRTIACRSVVSYACPAAWQPLRATSHLLS